MSEFEKATEPLAEDFLTVDTPIPGQNFVCLSFLSPETVLAKKSHFYIQEFLRMLQKEKKLDFASSGVPEEDVVKLYDDFIDKHAPALDENFVEKHGTQTNVRGLKVRGTFETYREAEIRSKALQKLDPNHNVFVGSVGYWLPWDPNPERVGNQEYQEQQLNDLMKGYNENIEKRNAFYYAQKEERKKKIVEENEQRKVANAAAATSSSEVSGTNVPSIFEDENIETMSLSRG